MVNIYVEDSDDFYKEVKKYIKKKNVMVHFCYDNFDIVNDDYLNTAQCSWDVKFKVWTVTSINIKDIRKRYSYIYDVVCDYLDYEFVNKNICGFCDDICLSVKNNGHCVESKNGCCYGTNRGLCKNFVDGRCIIKSLSCKLFTCRYLKKRGIRYRVNDIVLLKYFFNVRQKFILEMSIFKDKEEIINLLMKNK